MLSKGYTNFIQPLRDRNWPNISSDHRHTNRLFSVIKRALLVHHMISFIAAHISPSNHTPWFIGHNYPSNLSRHYRKNRRARSYQVPDEPSPAHYVLQVPLEAIFSEWTNHEKAIWQMILNYTKITGRSKWRENEIAGGYVTWMHESAEVRPSTDNRSLHTL